jgi:Arc/MetJ-type ribon-helix-helix transcriptional regulator
MMAYQPTTDELVRRNLTLYESSQQIMKELRHKLEASSDAEVVRYALRYLEQMLSDNEAGLSLVVEPRNGDAFRVMYQALKRKPDEDQRIVKRNLKMTQAAVDRIERMKDIVGVSSDSEIIRRALRYLWLILSEAESGSRFILTDGHSGTVVRMDILTSTPTILPAVVADGAPWRLANLRVPGAL